MRVEFVESSRPQTTIAQPIVFGGFSVTDFRPCTALIAPAPSGHGIVFEKDGVRVAVAPDNHFAEGPTHTTTLAVGNAKILTVEHFLAAVNALGIDNLLVRLGPAGLPQADFSADAFAEVMDLAGVVDLDAPRRILKIREAFRIDADDGDGQYCEVAPSNGEGLKIDVKASFGSPIGEMTACYYEGETDFRRDLGWARSFVPRPLEADGARWERVRERFPILPADPKLSPLIVFDANGPITPLRSPDEPARHKLVDCLGDLMLAGCRIAGHLKFRKPGHRFNALVARRLREAAEVFV
ncbi:MAG: UDP-3-O-acyl-N-acetylglucosamine deacetylase [Patescibacteria group bacterium]|nr:UDP-3-O-acyl-N-acetylglucosamine deacetylase [Patescibacteria group bacterium]